MPCYALDIVEHAARNWRVASGPAAHCPVGYAESFRQGGLPLIAEQGLAGSFDDRSVHVRLLGQKPANWN